MPGSIKLDSVIFDLGNTLVPFTPKDSMEFVVKWFHSSSAQDAGIEFNDFLEKYREVVRSERKRMLSSKWESSVEWRSERISELLDAPDHMYSALSKTHSGCFASCLRIHKSSRYVLDMVNSFVNEEGRDIKVALISNAADPGAIRMFLDRESLTESFEEIVISGEVGYAKPHSEIFTSTLAKMEVEPSRSVYVGDRYDVDFVGSKNAGMNPVYIRQYKTAGEPPDGVHDIEPTIEHILDLLPILEEWS